MDAEQIAYRIVNKSGSYQEVMNYAEGMISPLIARAESAEVRAAKAEKDCSNLMMIMSLGDAHMTTLTAERDEARRQLEQAREVCAYWLNDARFIVANTPKHNEAVEMLKRIVNDPH